MKKIHKFYITGLFVMLLAGSSVLADVVTTQRKINTQPAVKQSAKTYTNKSTSSTAVTKSNTKTVTVSRLSSSIKSCKPYSENMKSEYMGMNMTYELKIDGWVNNKCRLNFTAKTSGAGSSFKNMYGVDASDATILSFAPKIRCEFTKQQLEYVGDSILQEEERNNGARNNMLKDPNNISFDNISSTDMKLLDVVLNQQACRILNTEDLNNLMQNLMF